MSIYSIELKKKQISNSKPVNVGNPEKVYRYVMRKLYKPEDMWQEKAVALYTNKQNELIAQSVLSGGGTNCCTVDPKVITRAALGCLADGVIIVHNHPDNNPAPSINDINQTQKMKKCLECFDIKLIDHVVIAEGRYFSFAQEVTKNIKR